MTEPRQEVVRYWWNMAEGGKFYDELFEDRQEDVPAG